MQNLEKTPKNGIIRSTSAALNRLELTKFYVIVSAFIISTSVLAIYSTIQVTEHNSKKDDAQAHSIVHMVNSTDWWNDYQAHKVREKILLMEIDNLNISLLDQRQQPSLTGPEQPQDTYRQQTLATLAKYQGFIHKLNASESTEDSLMNLRHNAETEEKSYKNLNEEVAKNSKLVKLYDFVAILLIIGSSLGGISEIVKTKVLGTRGLCLEG